MSNKDDIELVETPSSSYYDEPSLQKGTFQSSLFQKHKNKIICSLVIIVIVLSIGLIIQSRKISNYLKKNYQSQNEMIFDYPTVGIPVPGKTYNTTKVSSSDLDIFDQEVNRLLKPFNDTNCDFVRLGDQPGFKNNDGGYLICKNAVNNIQAVINLGINGIDQFGCDLSTSQNVLNHQFDCTNPKIPICDTNNNKNRFNYVCAAAYPKIHGDWQFTSLQKMLSDRNLTKKHIFLKIDIEGGEWDTLKHFPVEDLQYIDQIAFEIHFDEQQWGQLDILRSMMKDFVNVNYHMNNYGCTRSRKLPSTAIQATLVNRKLLTFNSESQSYALHPLNLINNPNSNDCQMI